MLMPSVAFGLEAYICFGEHPDGYVEEDNKQGALVFDDKNKSVTYVDPMNQESKVSTFSKSNGFYFWDVNTNSGSTKISTTLKFFHKKTKRYVWQFHDFDTSKPINEDPTNKTWFALTCKKHENE